MLDLQIADNTITILDNIVNTNSSNAFILHGARGIGKRSSLESFLRKHLKINILVHHNLLLLDAKDSKVNSEIIRNISNFVYKTSYDNQNKFVVIDAVDKLNIFSHNALLKILEEPTANTIFFLISSRYQTLPATIKSRCISIRCLPPKLEQSTAIIKSNFPKLNNTEVEQYNYLSNNAPLLALKMITEQILEQYLSFLQMLLLLNAAPTKFFKTFEQLMGKFSANQINHLFNHLITRTIKGLITHDLATPIPEESEIFNLILAKHSSLPELLKLEQDCKDLLSAQDKTHLNIQTVAILVIYKAIYQ